MIQSFKCADTENLFITGKTRHFSSIKSVAERKLQQLDSAVTLCFLRSPPGNHLVSLSGKHSNQYSIRVNVQWWICFIWTELGPANVEIVDYH
ncbi:type II toxin-antitoxin system RelE/ParE family toxin [Polynucleobacter sphagniphilus]|uniref:type II toxin-antitoxin system RelE/ParE family toxin n=1 Tax=Polynucleobacter sphagniphilus TaxID=1743169 RepID=UPI00096B9C76|nr:type II toxin-antitoxin system RelE/ParE family toxin [Polynucleobacter sphagniphilus]MDH6242016.1 proteic killer suppression protein [Polynucleobacter sphagniphilus]MDH6249131.1 proteic killer suppression protein [Polynucleobacter sphagniphilus]